MIGRVLANGVNLAGLIRYLYGPGKANEHHHPHLVAGWRHPQELVPPIRPSGRPDLRVLTGLLLQPVTALGGRAPTRPVWHCVLRAAPDDPDLGDGAWMAIAERAMDRTGLSPRWQEDEAVRWIAVHHGDNHIHIVATLARQDGRRAHLHNEYYRIGETLREVEREYGLRAVGRPDRTAAKSPTRAEFEKAARAGQASTVDIGEAADLVPAIAQALWRQVSRAIHQGLLPGYVVREESSLVLRGRLLETAQLARHHGQPLPVEIRHDEFTVDILENQILRTACERMLLVPRVEAESSRMLRRLLRDFADVRSLQRRDLVPTWQPTRINARYHTALRLAELVLRATSVEHAMGSVAVNGFLLDMPQLFEDFVTVALREAIEDSCGGRVVAQSRHYMDEAGRVVLKPDIVWRIDGKAVAVIDAKYKAEKPSGFPNADLYQLLAYCTVLGLSVGHLVYAAGNEQPARHVVRQAGTEIVCHALNLSDPPEALLAGISSLAIAIAKDRPSSA